jgi:hypothetical protein
MPIRSRSAGIWMAGNSKPSHCPARPGFVCGGKSDLRGAVYSSMR